MNTQPFLAAAHRPPIHDTRGEAVLIRTPRAGIDYRAWAARLAFAAIAAGVAFVLIIRPVFDAVQIIRAHPPHAVAQGVE